MSDLATAAALIEDAGDIDFCPDTHTYRDGKGEICPSVTQLIAAAGLIDYSMVPTAVLAHAAWRGTLVHQAVSLINAGEDIACYDLPDECQPYVQAYQLFLTDSGYCQHAHYNEHRMLAEICGCTVGGTLDSMGSIWGTDLAVIEIKNTSSVHPSWGVQTAGYVALARNTDPSLCGKRIDRYALQLKRTGTYRLVPHEDDGDADMFRTIVERHRIESHLRAWKIKNNLL